MTNQELLEAIAGYMPYNVKAIARYEQKTISHKVGLRDLAYVLDRLDIIDFKLILHPLQDLTEPCLEGGKVPMEELSKMLDMNVVEYCFIEQNPSLIISTARYAVVQQLFKWHFDVFGLIEKGHAIDANTLSNDLKKL